MIYKMELRRRPCRLKEAKELYSTCIKQPLDIEKLARRLLKDEAQEVVLAFFLDNLNKVLGYFEAARGGFDACPIDPRVIFSSALIAGAAGIILVHNHPSGNPTPSHEDLSLTERVHDGSSLLGLALLDHLILGRRKKYVSLAERGLLLGTTTTEESDGEDQEEDE